MNLFDLFARIVLDTDDYEKGMEEASGKTSAFGEKLKGGLLAAGKAVATGLAATSTAIITLGKASVESFSEFEQLAGGAAKIFDEMDQSKILADAQNAYKTLGINANQYLSIMNDVGATFAATMGDEAGYNTASKGLKAISDYASGTGKNIDELSQKFTLITRSTASYQSIADQFSGILPATSEGFLEQAQAAGILSESYTSLTEVPIDEYQAAVAEMLEQGVEDLGLANNTAAEAMTTISGSLSMAKAAWHNLVTGIADENADLEVLIGNFVESVGAVARNIIPRVQTALEGAGKMVETLIPVIIEQIPPLVEETLPQLLESGIRIIHTILEGISSDPDRIINTVMTIIDTLINGIGDLLPEIIVTGVLILGKLAVGLIQAIPDLIKKIPEIIKAVVDEFKANGSTFLQIGSDIVNGIWEGIKAAWNAVVEWVSDAVDSVMNFISGGKSEAEKALEGEDDIPISDDTSTSRGSGRRGTSVTVNQNIYSEAKTAADLMEEAKYQQDKGVYLGV